MAIFTMGLESSALGKLVIGYEVPDEYLPRILAALAHRYGAEIEGRAKTTRELLRNLTDHVMHRELYGIRETIADMEAEKAREAVGAIPVLGATVLSAA